MDPRCRESLCHAWSRKGLRGGQYSLKRAYQYMESKVVKGTGKGGSTVSEVKTFVDKGKHFTNGRKID